MKEQIASIVRKVITEHFQLLESKSSKPKEHILVLLDYPASNSAAVWATLQTISVKYTLTLCLSERWSEIPQGITYDKKIQLHEQYVEEISEAINQADALLIPTASFGLLSKLALLIDDEPALHISIQMLMNGQKLIVVTDEIEHKGKKFLVPASVHDRVQQYLRQLRNDGVQALSLNKLQKWLNSHSLTSKKKPIVLARHIQDIAYAGQKEISVPTQAVITPLGKDMARELDISIHKEEKGKEE